MPIRPATWADLLPASQVAAAAFNDEALFGPVIHPNRTRYPGDPYLFFLRYLRKDFFNPTAFIFVSYAEDSPRSVTGMAVWYRQGPIGAAALKKQQSWSYWIAAKAVGVFNKVHQVFYPNRAADPAKVDVLDRAFPYCKHHWEVQARVENWYLNLCATGPKFQGMGFGRELVTWGIERAKEQKVCASVTSSEGNEKFYQRCGFGDVVGWANEGEGNPIAEVPGGAIMFTEVFSKA